MLTKDTEIEEIKSLPAIESGEYEINHEKIISSWNEIYEKKGFKRPTYIEIAEATGLSRQTVSNHIRKAKWEDITDLHLLNINPMLDDFLTLLQVPRTYRICKRQINFRLYR